VSTTKTILNGVVRGRTVELEQESGLPNGAKVSVTIEPPLQELLRRKNSCPVPTLRGKIILYVATPSPSHHEAISPVPPGGLRL